MIFRRSAREIGEMRLQICLNAMAVLMFGFSCAAQLPDASLASRAMGHIREAITSVPNYTCSETIDRQRVTPPWHTFQRVDLVKLQVEKVGDKELFAWQGAGKFEDKPIADFVGGGLIGDGTYSLFAEDIFLHDAAIVRFHGKQRL
jgi:hypothetical protein